MVVSTRALAPIGGQFGRLVPEAKPLIDQEYVVVTGADQARAAVRQARFDGADLIKVIVDNAINTLDVDEITAIVDEAHRMKMKVAAHAVSDLAIGAAITAGVDSIEHAYRASDASLARMAKQHIYLTPTDFPLDGIVDRSQPADRMLPRATLVRITQSAQKRLRKAVELSVPIAFGSDNYYGVPGATWGQVSLETLVAYVQTGIPAVQVLQAATINPATLLGLDNKIGSLEPGKVADIVAVPGNPLSDPLLLQRISFVMKAGEVVRDEARPVSR